jgi:hypothetical protein
MSPIPSAEGLKINWVNYHTRVKDIHFRMDAGRHSICISLEQRDAVSRHQYFEQFLKFKTLFHSIVEEDWEWQEDVNVEGKIISSICKQLQGHSVMNKAHWPELISFFKPRIIALDAFWTDAKYSFEDLK